MNAPFMDLARTFAFGQASEEIIGFSFTRALASLVCPQIRGKTVPTLDFKGKPFVYSHHLSVPFRELTIDAGKSLAGDGGPSLDDNLIIHGDNLHALKALLPKYAGKVDVIYIDPPYNTGNEGWAYNDNVNSPLMKEWLGKVVDGEDLERHDKWLCMMWPRLTLLKELLAETGAIFVSIDHNELQNLLVIMDEIFDLKHVATIAVVNNRKGRNDQINVATAHEYLVVFSKGMFVSLGLPMTQNQIAEFKYIDENGNKYATRDLRKRGGADTAILRSNLYFPIYFNQVNNTFAMSRLTDDDIEIYPLKSDGIEGCWRWGYDKIENNLDILSAKFAKKNSKWNISYRVFMDDKLSSDIDDEDLWNQDKEEPLEPTKKSKSFWWGPEISTDRGGKELKAIFEGTKVFDSPKSPEFIKRVLHMAISKSGMVLDSFAGSGTTAHAVQALNAEDGGNRKFILVETEDYADTITAERVRRVMMGVPNAKDEALKKGLGGSFTYCDLGGPIDMESFFGESVSMPAYDQLASYIAYTATGEALGKAPKIPAKDWFIGEIGGVRLHLIYKPDSAFMKGHDAALDMDTVKTIAAGNKTGKPSYVFAAAKYMGQNELTRDYDMTFCQLPYAIHRIMGDGVDA